MTILGIDPGSVRAGYGLIKKERGDFIWLESGLFKIPTKTTLGNQLLALEKDMEKFIKKPSRTWLVWKKYL